MIYMDSIPFEEGTEEWMKLAIFMNQRLRLMFDAELENQKVEGILNIDVEDFDFYHRFSLFYAPRMHSIATANFAVIGVYALLDAEGFFIPDLDMYYVIHRVIRNYMRRLKTDTGSTVLKICPEERNEFEELLKEVVNRKYNVEDGVTLEEVVEYYEDIRNYEDIIFRDKDYLLYDNVLNTKIRDTHIMSRFNREKQYYGRYYFQNVFTGRWVKLGNMSGKSENDGES